MVGVPGRSKSCSTCRKRRKGCDRQRPICGQCQKSDIECAGYYRDRVFVNSTADGSTTRSLAVYRVHKDTITLPNELACAAYEQRCLAGYFEAYLPNGQALTDKTLQNMLGGWSNTIRDLYNTDEVLRKTTLAMCLATLGRQQGEQWMIEESLKFYIGSLKEMTVALNIPSRARSDAILAATRLFSLFEAMHGTDDKNQHRQARSWRAHNAGDTALVVARRPEIYASGHAHRLFIDGRAHLAMTALSTRKKSILSNIEWKTIPWTQHKKTAKDKLVDILLDIPALLENFDIMQSVIDPAEKQIMHHGLVIHAWSLDAQLTEWHNKFPIDFPHSTPSNSNSIDLADLAAAHVATLYWSICIRLHTIFHDLVFLTHSTGTDLPERMDLKYYCHRIVTTLPIFFHPAVGTYRQHLAPFPIACVWRVIFRLGADEMAAEKKLLMSCLDLPESETIKKFLESLDVILPS